MKTGILFDLDGTLLSTLEDLTDAVNYTLRFYGCPERTMEEVSVDITGLTTVTQILSAMEQAGSAVPASSLVKFTLIGSHTLETQRDFRFLEKMLESRYYFVKIKDESRLEIAREDYEHDISLKGEFIRMVLASDKTEEEKERIIRFGIQALLGQEVET